jgi:hypothetical protein
MLFIDYSSAFCTIVPTKLITKLRTMGLNTSLCNLMLDFLMGHPQVVRIGNNTSAMLILNTGAPQGCLLSRVGREFQVPWCPHHQLTIMVQTHQASCEEATTTHFPPYETEKIWHGSPEPQKVIQLHHREHPDRLHHRLVWQPLSI